MKSYSQFMEVANSDGYTSSGTDINDYPISSTSVFTTAPFFVGRAINYSVEVASLDAPISSTTVKLQASNDRSRLGGESPDDRLTFWVDQPFVDSSGAIITSQTLSGNRPVVMFQEPACSYGWIRAVVTVSSGSARLSIQVQWKDPS